MTDLRVNVWSGPRNVSTALMYAFGQRADTTVVDEPFYAHYLDHTGVEHPGRDEVLASQSTDARAVLDEVLLADHTTPVLVAKQMAHHLRGLPDDVRETLDRDFRQVLLIRDPALVVRSYRHQVARPTLDDLGYRELVGLLDAALDGGSDPVVVDSTVLLEDPGRVLTVVCERLGIGFDPAMLAWPAGPKEADGVWAPHWYANVHRSTGFTAPHPAPTDPLPAHLAELVDEARPLHDRLQGFAIA